MNNLYTPEDARLINNDNYLSVTVVGGGSVGERVIHLLKYAFDISVIYCFDNDSKKWGTTILDYTLCTKPFYIENSLILICTYKDDFAMKLEKQCFDLGYASIYRMTKGCVQMLEKEMDDERFISYMYHYVTGRALNMKKLFTYNEKIQWLKLNDDHPKYKMLTDKLAVKDYVRKTVGEKYVIPTLGVWDHFDDIDFDILPNRFVLKCTHDSGSTEICKNKEDMDYGKLKSKFAKLLTKDYYYAGREQNYRNIPRKIIAEPLLVGEKNEDIKDYKVFMFGGEPRIIQVDYNRFSNHTRVMYSTDWKPLGFTTLYPYGESQIEPKPKELDDLLNVANRLGTGLKHVRLDFYIVNGSIFFGEFTFHHGGGLEPFSDEEWNYRMGQWIEI